MPRPGGKPKKKGYKVKKPGVKGGHQKRSASGFSLKRNGRKGALNLSQWSNAAGPSVGSRKPPTRPPTKRKRPSSSSSGGGGIWGGDKALTNAFPAPLRSASVEFAPSVLKFDPFKPSNDTTSAVEDLQRRNLEAFEAQFGTSDKADRKRRRDLQRKAHAVERKAAVQALTAGNIFGALDDSDDEEGSVRRTVLRGGGGSGTKNNNSSAKASNSAGNWDTLFQPSESTLVFAPPKPSASETAAEAAVQAAAAAAAQEELQLSLQQPTLPGAGAGAIAGAGAGPIGQSSSVSNRIGDSVANPFSGASRGQVSAAASAGVDVDSVGVPRMPGVSDTIMKNTTIGNGGGSSGVGVDFNMGPNGYFLPEQQEQQQQQQQAQALQQPQEPQPEQSGTGTGDDVNTDEEAEDLLQESGEAEDGEQNPLSTIEDRWPSIAVGGEERVNSPAQKALAETVALDASIADDDEDSDL